MGIQKRERLCLAENQDIFVEEVVFELGLNGGV